MITKDLFCLLLASTAVFAFAASAQDSVESDEAVTLLDQTVPVADEGPPEAAPADSETATREALMEAFNEFQRLQDAGVYDQAENVAKRVIELSIQMTGPQSNETAKALNNLAVVQHRNTNYEAAQQNFQSAIDIITDNEDQLTGMLINPLKGLGAAQLASGRPDLAWGTYRRAMHISHVNDGPHNLGQVDILEALAETNLRLGELEDARNVQDQIYGLHLRSFDDNAIEMVPPLLRLARWQHRTGYVLDERATYRRVIRILELVNGRDHISLIDPLTMLGKSYFFIDTSNTQAYQTTTAASGETYFKRAVRIAENSDESDWQTIASTKLALGDYYSFRGDPSRARGAYRDVWELLSTDEERLDIRRQELESIVVLNEDPLPRYVGGATRDDTAAADGLRQGQIIATYDISARGRVSDLRIVEATPEEFEGMQRMVVRELRTRVYRPRFENAQPVDTPNQSFSHSFFYRQEALEELRAQAEMDDS